ncbi:hypothetical protein KA005_44010 [bacterium]|nr:hypothetical protein [bacterium]
MKKNKNNRLIAEFMGLEVVLLSRHNNLLIKKYDTEEFPTSIDYHCSWDWLMPVVEKIELILSKSDVPNYYSAEGYKYWIDRFKNSFLYKETLYEISIEFIKQYNKQHKK